MSAALLTTYAVGILVTVFMGIVVIGFGTTADRKPAARVILLSPAWPLLAIHGLCVAIPKLWRMAGWGEA